MAVDPAIPQPLTTLRSAADPGAEPLTRLADQLHGLSRLAETLTIRLLELEERLQSQQERLEPLMEAAHNPDPAQAEALDLRLEETEQRLAQLESLLQGGATLRAIPTTGFRARPPFVADGRAVAGLAADGEMDEGAEMDLDPFPEEGEQPFMDERVA
jgi:hypothetical protein